MAVTYQQESFISVENDVMKLAEIHYNEVAQFKDYPLNIDFNVYKNLDIAGITSIYTIRDELNLVGYSIYITSKNPHYQFIQACSDSLFIHPDYRKKNHGKKFLKYCESQLIKNGVEFIYTHSTTRLDITSFLKKCGYVESEITLVKRLKNG